jgi:hypothetical protein
MPTLAADIDIAIELAHGALAEIAAEELRLSNATNRRYRPKPAQIAASPAKDEMLRSGPETISTAPAIAPVRRWNTSPFVVVSRAVAV